MAKFKQLGLVTDEQIDQFKADQDALFHDIMELSDKAIKKLATKTSKHSSP